MAPGHERGRLEQDRALLQRLQADLEAGHAVRTVALTEVEERLLTAYQFVTRLPVLVIINIGEDDLPRAAEIEAAFAERHGGPGVAFAALCAKVEAELATMDEAEAVEDGEAVGFGAAGEEFVEAGEGFGGGLAEAEP